MEYKDYYKTLGVERKASSDEIKKAYRDLAMKYHPDRNQGNQAAEEKFKEINEAHQVLGDEKQRVRYDQMGSSYTQWQQHGGSGNFNWDDWFVQNPAGGSGGVRVNMEDLGDIFGSSGGGGFSDFFNMFFGGAGAGGRTQTRRTYTQQQQPRRNARQSQNVEHLVKISLNEAYHGTERMVQIDGRKLQVKIPAGSKTGTKVRMANVGPATAFGQKSDVYLKIEVLPSNGFERKGNDLHSKAEIDLYAAVLGGQTKVHTMSGDVFLTVPPGTQPGQKFRLSGKGMPILRKSEHGDLYVQIKVSLPKDLSAEQRQLFEKLRES